MDVIAKSGRAFLKEQVEAFIIFAAKEDLLPAVSTEHHVVNTPWNMDLGLRAISHLNPV